MSNTVISCSEIFIPEEIKTHNERGVCKCRTPYTFNLNFENCTLPLSFFYKEYPYNGFKTYEIADRVRRNLIGYTFKEYVFLIKNTKASRKLFDTTIRIFDDITEVIEFLKCEKSFNMKISYGVTYNKPYQMKSRIHTGYNEYSIISWKIGYKPYNFYS